MNTSICTVDGCLETTKTKKIPLCPKHYMRKKRYGDPLKTVRRKITEKLCSVTGCKGLTVTGDGFCKTHYSRWKRHGNPEKLLKRSKAEEGSRFYNDVGYILIKCSEHPNSGKDGWIREHRLVMSLSLGRPLLTKEEVHHKNGVRDDNRIENLELWSKSQPPGGRVEDLVNWAKEIKSIYAPTELW